MSDSPSPSAPLVLHIWPAHGQALSLDPASAAALLYLQLAIPGRFSVAHCANPDVSPSGQLPYLTHGLRNASTFPSIVKYVAHLEGAHDTNGSLTPVEKARLCARIAHVQSDYGDLVAHMLYSLHSNWWKTTRPVLVAALPIPHRYYVADRVRESYKPRLEASELWGIPGLEDEEQDGISSVFRKEKKRKSQLKSIKFKNAFRRDQVLAKARALLSIYSKLLGDNRYFHLHSDRPTTLDIVFAAHTHVLMSIPFADPLLQTLLSDSYPTLVAHANAVQSFVFPDPVSLPPTADSHLSCSLHTLLPRQLPFSWRSRRDASSNGEEDKRYALARWGWAAIAVGALAVYFQLFGLGPGLQIAIISKDVNEDDADEDAEEDEEEDELDEEELEDDGVVEED